MGVKADVKTVCNKKKEKKKEILFSIERNELLNHEKKLLNFRSILKKEMC